MDQVAYPKFSTDLNLHFVVMEDLSYKFEDGVVYSYSEVLQLKRLKVKVGVLKYPEYLQATHRLKQFFNVEVGMIMPLN